MQEAKTDLKEKFQSLEKDEEVVILKILFVYHLMNV